MRTIYTLAGHAPDSVVSPKWLVFRCAQFGLGLGARRENIPRGSSTDEQQRPSPNSAQPSGRQFFLSQTSLLLSQRPMKGILLRRFSSDPNSRCPETPAI